MKLTIFGATGGIGRHLLDQARTAGHEITAVVRDPARLPRTATTALRVVTADLATPDPALLQSAVAGADGVLSTLGPATSADRGITAPATRAVIAAMQAAGTRRIVAVSAAPVSTTPSPARPHPPRRDAGEAFLTRHLATPVTRRLLAAHFADLAAMEDALRTSGLDWTAVRPPRLTAGPLSTTYRTALDQNLPHGGTVSRASVAHFMLRALTDPTTVHHALGIAD
jgi:uncharacterized protein YbjT (DUF2867 family)